ncbi:hypothetical protein GCM10010533_21030 [Mycolicibacterium pallens]
MSGSACDGAARTIGAATAATAAMASLVTFMAKIVGQLNSAASAIPHNSLRDTAISAADSVTAAHSGGQCDLGHERRGRIDRLSYRGVSSNQLSELISYVK